MHGCLCEPTQDHFYPVPSALQEALWTRNNKPDPECGYCLLRRTWGFFCTSFVTLPGSALALVGFSLPTHKNRVVTTC